MEAINISNLCELTPSQVGILSHTLRDPLGTEYVQQIHFRIEGPLAIERFRESLNEVARRHECLRAGFLWEAIEKPLQVIVKDIEIPFQTVDWRSIPHEQIDHELNLRLETECTSSFDLSNPPLMKCILVRTSEESYTLGLTYHHLIFDGWSLGVLLHETLLIYEALAASRQAALPDPFNFSDYVMWLQRKERELTETFWRRCLQDVVEGCELRVETGGGQRDKSENKGSHQSELNLSEEDVASIRRFTQREGITLNTLLQGAWGIMLSRYCGSLDVIFGTTVSGRPATLPGVESLVGMCINTLPVRLRFTEQKVRSWLSSLQTLNLDIEVHAHASLIDIQSWANLPHGQLLFNTAVVVENYPAFSEREIPSGLRISDVIARSSTHYPLAVIAKVHGGLQIQFVYHQEHFTEEVIGRLSQDLRTILIALVSDADQWLSQIPVLSTSKIDRATFPSPVTTRNSEGFAAPETAVEKAVARVWEEVLQVDRVGTKNSFFELGGNSLSAFRLVYRVSEQLGKQLSLQAFYAGPTVGGIARWFEQGIDKPNRQIELSSRTAGARDIPLSFSQRRLWLISHLHPELGVYNISNGILLRGEMDLKVLKLSLELLVARHDALRTIFPDVDGKPRQAVVPVNGINLPVVDLTIIEPDKQWNALEQLAQEEADKPFDLANGPLVRFKVFRLKPKEHAFILTIHHIVSDGMSMELIERELSAAYSSFRFGDQPRLPEVTLHYSDFALWEQEWANQGNLQLVTAYWQKQLAEVYPLNLPTDYPRPSVPDYRGARERIQIGPELTFRVHACSRSRGITPFMILVAAYQLLLSRYADQDDIAVGTPVSGRDRPELEYVVGAFVNTLVLRTDLSGNPTVGEFLERVKDVCLSAYSHQSMPFERLVEVLHPDRDPTRNPLFQAMLAMQYAEEHSAAAHFSGLVAERLALSAPSAKFDINMLLDDAKYEISGVIEYSSSLFHRDTIRQFSRNFCNVLQQVVAEGGVRLSEVRTVDGEEEERIVLGFNATERVYAREELIYEGFEKQVERYPQDCALEFCGHRLSYEELNRRANQTAHVLQELGVGPGKFVGIMMDRSLEMVIAVLAVLKSGGAYVPMEPSYPEQRRRWIIGSLKVSCLLSQSWHGEGLRELSGLENVICLDGGCAEGPWRHWSVEQIERRSGDNLVRTASSEDLAYVIFTSGSTGQPKGVMVQHRPVVNLMEWVNREFHVDRSDRLLFVTSLCFDLSVYDIFGILSAGGTVEVASQQDVGEPAQLAQRLYSGEISFWDSAPAALQQLMGLLDHDRAGQSRLRLVFLSGDWIPVTLPGRIRQLFGERVEVISLGGATEATVWSNYHRVREVDAEWISIPYGRPIQNSRYHVLDRDLNCCPVGVSGDLYIGGDCLSLGYANEPLLTAGKYIPDPYASRGGDRLYLTGDRARYWKDGALEFLGRSDQQIKVRGYRVEPGEVEAALCQHPDIREAAVIADGPRGEKHLIAYLVAEHNEAVSRDRLRTHLRQRLPEYMVPSIFLWLEQMPVTGNGKLDRGALPKPVQSPENVQHDGEATTTTQQLLANIWRQVLNQQHVGIHDNFFDIGGHSLLAMQVISNVREFLDIKVSLRSFFESPTIAQLADAVRRARHGGLREIPIVRSGTSGKVPLSFAQERIWFLTQLQPDIASYVIPLGFRIRGPLSVRRLEFACNQLIGRHEALRTSFYAVDGIPFQRTEDTANLEVSLYDCRHVLDSERDNEIDLELARQARLPFEFGAPPLLRAKVLAFSEDDYGLIFVIHHLIFDGWSSDILLRELSHSYTVSSEAQKDLDTEEKPQYPDYALWQRKYLDSSAFQDDLAYWRSELAFTGAITLPLDHVATSDSSNEGRLRKIELDGSLSRAMQELSRREGLTLFMTLFTGVAVLLHRWTDSELLTIGTVSAGRERPELRDLIGLFVNTLALNIVIRGDMTIRQVLSGVRAACLGAFEHADVPFDAVVEKICPDRKLNENPLFRVMVLMDARRDSFGKQIFEGTVLSKVFTAPPEAKFDLTIEFSQTEELVTGSVIYSPALYREDTIQMFLARLTLVYQAMTTSTSVRISHIPLAADVTRSSIGVLTSATS